MSSDKAQNVIQTGFLTKQGGMVKTWKNRFFVLTSSALSYYETPNSRKALRNIPLANITGIEASSDVVCEWPVSELERCFGVATETRTFYAVAAAMEDVLAWKIALSKALLANGHLTDEQTEKVVLLLKALATKAEFCRRQIVEMDVTDTIRQMREHQNQTIATAAQVIWGIIQDVGRSTASGSPSGVVLPAPGHGRINTTEIQELQRATMPKDEASAAAAVDASWEIIQDQVEATPAAKPFRMENRKRWKEVRVFVSSTFADMYAEREVLVRKVFPELRSWCEERKLFITECDLRWGVPKESTSEVVFRTCLGEVDRCFEQNVNPFFINLLSHRYGWVPTGHEIPPSVAEEYSWVPLVSITHMEILHAALRSRNPNAAFFLRDGTFLTDLPDKFRQQFQDFNPLPVAALARLKDELRQRFSGKVFDYKCAVKGVDATTGVEKVELEGLDDFADNVLNFLKKSIEEQYPLSDEPLTLCEQLAGPQVDFIDTQLVGLIGRQSEVNSALEFAKRRLDHPEPPVVFSAPLGAGKASLLTLIHKKACEQGIKSLFHTSSVSSEAADVTTVLLRIVLELGDEPQQKAASELSLQDQSTAEKAASLCKAVIEKASDSDVPILILLDNVQGFSSSGDKKPWHLLPRVCRGNLHIIASADTSALSSGYIDAAKQEVQAAQQALGPDAVQDDEPQVKKELPELSHDERRDVVISTLGRFNKRLDEEQLTLLLDNPGSTNLLWLKTACEELRVFGVFETVTRRIKSLDTTLDGLLRQVLERVSQEDDTPDNLLKTAAVLLALSRDGLTEPEMLSLLGRWRAQQMEAGDGDPQSADSSATSEDSELPMAIWAPIKARLNALITRSSDGNLRLLSKSVAGIALTFFAPETQAEVTSSNAVKYYQQHLELLVAYFSSCQDNSRRRSELPHQLLQLGDKTKLMRFLSGQDWHMIQPYDRRRIVDALKCREMVMRMNNTPQPEMMCMGCANKMYERGNRVMRCRSCVMCGTQVFSTPMRPGEAYRPTFGESQAVRCRRHADTMSYHPGSTMIKCYFCNMPVHKPTSYPVLLCRTCSPFGISAQCCQLTAN